MTKEERRKRLTALSGTALALGVVAALIWAKLRIVAAVPRQVYADPRNQPPVPAQVEAQAGDAAR